MKKHNDLTLDELVQQITSSVDPSWDVLKQIRYVYIELGLYLEKNTDFFMSVMNKVQSKYKLSGSDIREIYNDNLEDGSRKDWDKVICRSAAIILSKCLDKLGIENRIINTTNAIMFGEDNDIAEIRHVFVNAKISRNKSIFLTLAADLPYIQNDMQTQMFGNMIGYKKRDENGNEIILYEGEEIKDAVTIDNKTLLEIDSELGYATKVEDEDSIKYVYSDYFFDHLRKQLIKNKLYNELIVQESEMYNRVYSGKDFRLNISDIKKIQNIIVETCKYITEYLGFDFDFSGNFNYEDWRDTFYNELMYLDKMGRSAFNESSDNIYKIVDSFIQTVADIGTSVLTNEVNQENVSHLRDKFNKKFQFLCRHFINPDYFPSYDENGLINQNYISKKLEVVFSYIFGCNEEIREFNKLSYNEQIAIINIVIPLIFTDVKDKNCMEDKRSKCMACIYNIIRTYTLRMLNDGSYELLFEIDNSDSPMYYTYNLNSNKFKKVTQTKMYFLARNNIICSKGLKDKLKIEEIEEDQNKSR